MSEANKDLRERIAKIIIRAREGHIPSSYSIVDIINFLYKDILSFKKKNPAWEKRDYFVLSKGHGCAALYAVLEKFSLLKKKDLDNYSTSKGILGGHPDCTKVPFVEASTGSLGHGFPTATGIALGLKIKKKNNKIIVLLGDGECHEGSVWESANIANNLNLGNICAIIDWNGSAAQLMPQDDLINKWKAFGWNVFTADGHDDISLKKTFKKINFRIAGKPNVILARTTKGKGVSFMEGHGQWHHKIPNLEEQKLLFEELK